MTGADMALCRHAFGLGRREFAVLLGYTGEPRNNWVMIKRYESGKRDIPPTIERLVKLLRWYHHTTGETPDFETELEIA